MHNPLCGHSGCVEANGDLYSCDRYAFPEYYLGNIMDTDMKILMDFNRDFGMNKIYGLSDECFSCRYVKLCFGGCPKHRINGG
ncbi:MAG: SPASM domain-containing protein, partial [Synergistaceae bacterium]|nr:SPASM domain-containing protein [Synergistaceae bacterium]